MQFISIYITYARSQEPHPLRSEATIYCTELRLLLSYVRRFIVRTVNMTYEELLRISGKRGVPQLVNLSPVRRGALNRDRTLNSVQASTSLPCFP
jgi:hypothetical protein